jgi:hypothetical protein
MRTRYYTIILPFHSHYVSDRKVVAEEMQPDKLVKQCGIPGKNGFFTQILSRGIRVACNSGVNKRTKHS